MTWQQGSRSDEWGREARRAVETGLVHDKPERIVTLAAELHRARKVADDARRTLARVEALTEGHAHFVSTSLLREVLGLRERP